MSTLAAAMPAILPPMTTAVPRPRSAHLGNVQIGVVHAGGVRRRAAPLGNELLVVQPDPMEAVVFQPGSGGFDHRRRTAEVDVGFSAGEHLVRRAGR